MDFAYVAHNGTVPYRRMAFGRAFGNPGPPFSFLCPADRDVDESKYYNNQLRLLYDSRFPTWKAMSLLDGMFNGPQKRIPVACVGMVTARAGSRTSPFADGQFADFFRHWLVRAGRSVVPLSRCPWVCADNPDRGAVFDGDAAYSHRERQGLSSTRHSVLPIRT